MPPIVVTDWWVFPAVGIGSLAAVSGIAAGFRQRHATLVARARAAEDSAHHVLASEERFRLLFDRGADPQLLSDGRRIVAANPAATALLAGGAADRLIGLEIARISVTAGVNDSANAVSFETDVTAVNGAIIPVSLRRTRISLDAGELHHFQLRDLRETRRLEGERRELEAQLLASQRLEALGTLAGGVAHDFNNLLTVIRANSEIAQLSMKEKDSSGVTESLTAIVQATDRARDIVKQILLFSRRSARIRAKVNFAALITDTQTLLRATIPSTVQLLVEIRAAEAWIDGDATQMQQLLLNLCSNAEYAMRSTDGGILRLTVDTVMLQEVDQRGRHPHLLPGAYVRLIVRDTGTGMIDDVRQRIFEPFFTTKPIGEGTGLGLAVLHGIVLSHQGSVHVDSVEGGGTTFELLFAMTAPPSDGASAALAPLPPTTSIITPRDRAVVPHDAPLILLVDDEPGILRAAERGIVSAGMRVITAASGHEALSLLDEYTAIDVLITDQTMPEMTGLALIERVRESLPSLPIILSTGYTVRISPDRLRDASIQTVLEKPYSLTQLIDAIHGALQPSGRFPTHRG